MELGEAISKSLIATLIVQVHAVMEEKQYGQSDIYHGESTPHPLGCGDSPEYRQLALSAPVMASTAEMSCMSRKRWY